MVVIETHLGFDAADCDPPFSSSSFSFAQVSTISQDLDRLDYRLTLMEQQPRQFQMYV